MENIKIIKESELRVNREIKVLKKFLEFLKPHENDKTLIKINDRINPMRNKLAKYEHIQDIEPFSFNITQDYGNTLKINIFYYPKLETFEERVVKLKDGSTHKYKSYDMDRNNYLNVNMNVESKTVKSIIEAVKEYIERNSKEREAIRVSDCELRRIIKQTIEHMSSWQEGITQDQFDQFKKDLVKDLETFSKSVENWTDINDFYSLKIEE